LTASQNQRQILEPAKPGNPGGITPESMGEIMSESMGELILE
jgi:hypothetical protein